MRFGLLGSLEVWSDQDEAVDVGGAQPRAVLAALLAAEGRVVPAEALIEAVWGSDPPDSAAGTLQTYISRLRRALEPERNARHRPKVLVTDPAGYRLAVPAEAVDFRLFEVLAEEGRIALEEGQPAQALEVLGRADGLWRGPALVELPDADFVRGLIVRLEERRVITRELRLEAELALGRSGSVAARAAEAIAASPLQERLRAILALALYRSGRQGEALRALEDARRTLAEELGVEPSRQLRDLEASILVHDPTLDLANAAPAGQTEPVPAPAPAPQSTPPSSFVGRQVELGQLRLILDESARGARFAVVEGEPGIGKTRLLEALAAEAGARGALVAWGRTHEGGAAPAFWPWLEVLRTVVEAHPDAGGGISQVLDPAGTDVGSLPGTSSFRLFEAVADALAAAARAGGIVILLDDLQWADPDSLELLAFLTGHLQDEPLLVVGTIREGDVSQSDGIVDALSAVTRRPSSRRLSLRGLPAEDVTQLLRTTTGREVSTSVAEAINERTEGNPFFAGELARLLAEDAALDDAAAARVRSAVPVGVRDVVRQRLGRLPAPTVELLGVGAVLGRDIELDLLARAADRSLDQIVDDLEPALEARLLIDAPGGGGGLRFSHALVRESLVDELSSLRRARLHLRAADAVLERSGPSDDIAEIVADHLWAAAPLGVGARAAAALDRAGGVAARRGAFESAEHLFDRSVTLRRAAGDGEAELRSLIRLLDVRRVIGDYALIASSYERAIDLARRAGRDDLLVELLWGEFSVHSITGDFARGRELADQLWSVCETSLDPALRMAGRTAAGIQCWDEGRITHMRTHLAEAVSLSEALLQAQDGWTLFAYQRLLAQTFFAYAQALSGESEAAHVRFAALAGPPADGYQRTSVATFWGSTLLMTGNFATLETVARDGLASDPVGPNSFWNAHLTMMLGLALLQRGELDEGRSRFADGFARNGALGIRTALAGYLASAGLSLLAHGLSDEAADFVIKARNEYDLTGQGWAEPIVLLAEAELLVARRGGPEEVAARFSQAENRARAQGSVTIAERIAAAAAAHSEVGSRG